MDGKGGRESVEMENIVSPRSKPLLAAGTRIADRYVVVRALGEGGMGQVFEVEHEAIGRHFALKLLNNTSFSEESLRRFRREAKALGRVDSARVAQVTDFGFEPTRGPFYVMELLDGVTLEERLRSEHRLALQDAIPIALDLCEALAEVHRAAIIHRDLKPSNIGLTRGGPVRVKLLDFGLAAAADGAMLERITKSQEVVGSLPYMAPERFYDAPLTFAIDLYALGVVLYEMLTGRLPYPSHSAPALINHHLNEQPLPLKEAAPELDIPPSIEAVIVRLLDKAPSQRFALAEAAGRALQAAAIDAPMPTLSEGGLAMDVASTLAAGADEEDPLEGPTLAQPAPDFGDSKTGKATPIPTSVVPIVARTPLPVGPTAPARTPFVGGPQTPVPATLAGEAAAQGWVSGSLPKTAYVSTPAPSMSTSSVGARHSRSMGGLVALVAAAVIGSVLAATTAIVIFKVVGSRDEPRPVAPQRGEATAAPVAPILPAPIPPPPSQSVTSPMVPSFPPPSSLAPPLGQLDGGTLGDEAMVNEPSPEGRVETRTPQPAAKGTRGTRAKRSYRPPRWTGGVIDDPGS